MSAPTAPTDTQLHALLMAHAAQPRDPMTMALAGVMASAPTRPAAYAVPVARLSRDDQQALMSRFFPSLGLRWPTVGGDALDEFDDLVALLLSHAGADADADSSRWLAHAIATACMGANHLWQDMGLPSRDALNALMQDRFASLKALNANNMRWKKFLYRELCVRADVLICKSPSCDQCVDEPVCFGAEQGRPLLTAATRAAA